MQEHQEKVLLLATAPLGVVESVAGLVAAKHPGARLTMLIKSGAAVAARKRFHGWDIIEYPGGPIAPWNDKLPAIETLKHAAAAGIYYACNYVSPAEYINVELAARMINPSKCKALSMHGEVKIINVPEQILIKLASDDTAGAKADIYEFLRSNSIEISVRSTTTSRGPKSAALFLTGRCNYKCVMCAFHSEEVLEKQKDVNNWNPRGADELDLERALSLVDELAALGVGAITLSGYGETMMYSGLEQVAKRVMANGMVCNVFTNGSLMGPDKIRFLIETNVSRINISLNSFSPKSYAEIHKIRASGFNTVLDNTKALLRARGERPGTQTTIGFSFVISKINMEYLEEMIALSDETGVDFALIHGAFFSSDYEMDNLALDGGDKAILREKLEKCIRNATKRGKLDITTNANIGWGVIFDESNYYSKYPCYSGWDFIAVSPAGKVVPCCGCGKTVGNVYKASLSDIWNGPEYLAIREHMMSLPKTGKSIDGCCCFSGCPNIVTNELIHNKVEDFNKYASNFFGQ